MVKNRRNTNDISVSRAFIVVMLLALFCVNACTSVTLNTIPIPPSSAKLRVFVLALTESDPPRKIWVTSEQEYSQNMARITAAFLKETGVYEVVPGKEVRAVLGNQTFTDWQWLKNDLALVKQVSKALHADYAIIAIRGYGVHFEFKMLLVNPDTGMEYKAGGTVFRQVSSDWILNEHRKMVRTCYRRVFHEAKSDLLATAVRKGRLMPIEQIKKPEEIKVSSKPPAKEEKLALAKEPLKPKTPAEVSVPQANVFAKPPVSPVKKTVPDIKKDTEAPKVITKVSPPPPDRLPVADKRLDFEKRLEEELQNKTRGKDKDRLVIYDFDTIERLNVVALILTEALREELFILGRFVLVNRENMMQVVQELKLQQSGLVDEKQVVELGKWLAANEAVTGRLAVMGNTYVLQAKRTDIKTLGTLGLGSLKCAAGHEDELLSGMPGLAKKLVEIKK
jgi:hypothetical protein